jgi:copper chaperone CopZ
MKTIKIIISFLMLFTVNKAFSQQVNEVALQVNGLTCSMCSQATEKSLKTLSYVDQVKPDLNRNVFVVTFKKGSNVSFDQLGKKVKDAGFSVGKLDATLTFNQAKIDENGQAIVGNQIYRFENVKDKVLNGPTKVSVIDKNFIPSSIFKQKAAKIKFDSYASGTSMVNGKKARIYHLSI